jgi:mannitol/fructose-specific phosphotransferase system IIA component (Ntr-type)
VALIVVAAIAAFASTGNAGALSASRYPLAMARDRLVSPRFEALGRFRTPTFSILVTGLLMVVVILLLDVAGIAKLASAFQLVLFSLLNLAVVIMRESRIEAYDPGFRSPLYPWMQIFGILAPVWLITEMGQMAILFTLGLVALTVGWYFHYARARVVRAGAIFHTFERLGELRHRGLDLELRSIVREKGLRKDDPFDVVVARAPVLDIEKPVDFATLSRLAAGVFTSGAGVPVERLEADFVAGMSTGGVPVAHGAALPHIRIAGLPGPLMLLARCRRGIEAPKQSGPGADAETLRSVRAVFFLVSAAEHPAIHLRLLGHVATLVEDPNFLTRWLEARDESDLKATLLRDEHWLTIRVGETPLTLEWVGRTLVSLELPEGCLMALIQRDGRSLIPGGSTMLYAGDHVTIIGDPQAIRAIADHRADVLELSR